ncbi:MAG TPA: ABC transporter permease [Thermoanaerobaculia bacterium]
MLNFLLRRLAASLLLLWLVLTLTFFLIHLAPGDPIHLVEDQRLTQEQRERLERVYHLDRPVLEQYVAWLGAVVLHGDWGISFSQQRPVSRVIADFLPRTCLLAGAALLVEYGVALGLGIAAARRRGATDHLVRIVSLLLHAQPLFWFGLMSILLFSYVWPILPAGGFPSNADAAGPLARFFDLLRHLALPALVLGLYQAGSTLRFVRGSLLEVMSRDFIRAARAKGLSETRVVWVHGLRNALTPVIQLFGFALPSLLGGTLVIEAVFSWPGIGWLTFISVGTRDYPVLLATTALSGALVAAGSLLADLLHAAANPMVRAEEHRD